MLTLHDSFDFAHRMHAGVNDWAGLPYISHPVWVMLNLPAKCSEDDRHIALLHDVFEDCYDRLCIEFPDYVVQSGDKEQNIRSFIEALESRGYSSYVMKGLRLLTRDIWNLPYIKYVENIVKSGHEGAMWVKYTDNTHNTHPDRTALLSAENLERSVQMKPRYEKSKRILRVGLGIGED